MVFAVYSDGNMVSVDSQDTPAFARLLTEQAPWRTMLALVLKHECSSDITVGPVKIYIWGLETPLSG